MSAIATVSFRRQAVLMALVMGVVEILVVALPLWTLYRLVSFDGDAQLEMIIGCLAAMQFLWWLLCAFWLRPLWSVARARKRGESESATLTRKAYWSTWTIPTRALLLRTAAWTGLAAGLLFVEQRRTGLETRVVLELCALTLVLSLTVSSFRAVWLSMIARRLRDVYFSEIPALRRFSDGYVRALTLVTLVISSMTMSAIIAFITFFLPTTFQPFLRLGILAPLALSMALFGILFFSHRFRGRLDSYIRQRGDSDDPIEDFRAAAMFRRAQRLPYELSIVHVVVWLLSGAFAIWLARLYFRIDFDDAILMFGIVAAIAIGSAIYLALWYREVLRPIRTHLTLDYPLPEPRPRNAFSLRAKLLVSFGGMMLFACGMALFWGFMQYKNLVTGFTSKQAELGLAWLRSEVQAEAAGRPTAPTPDLVREVLNRVAKKTADTQAVIYFLAKGNQELMSFGGGVMGSPPLPWYTRAHLAQGGSSAIELRAHGLAGRKGALEVTWQNQTIDLGVLALIYPSYRGRGVAVVRPLQELVVFFLVLFAACAGIVVLTVSQFVRPIRTLEERADGMARGELLQPVSSEGEGDEIGRLTFALEQMRRALSEKIRTTEEINADLERAVLMRTAALESKNRELAETLQKLTVAQDQLVRQEKMASIGQLVAGIAHEINNPVNAIVNTVGPLEEAIGAISAKDPEQARDAANDVGEMLRVVHRGAERTKAIVQALHNYSRTDDEKLVEVDINRSLDDSLELLRHVWRKQVTVEKHYGEVGRLRGHAGQLNQVFMNLLTNAAQALAAVDGARIVVETKKQDGKIAISIRDNGAGISPDVLPRIFDPFFTTKDVGEGTGLGLSIVHGIVERHGGHIEVQSQVGIGTAFTVFLPLPN